jgi:hypothetical protein
MTLEQLRTLRRGLERRRGTLDAPQQAADATARMPGPEIRARQRIERLLSMAREAGPRQFSRPPVSG